MNTFRSIATMAAFLLLVSGHALAATVTIAPIDAKTYTVQGTGMDGVAGIDLTIGYDNASLSTPSVTQGSLVSGALMAANTGSPGAIKIAIISTKTFSGSGPIVTISFAGQQGSGGITSFTGSLLDLPGNPVAAAFKIVGGSGSGIPGLSSTPGIPFQSTPSPTPQTTTSSPTPQPATPSVSGSSTPTYLGTVTMPGDSQTTGNAKPADVGTIPASPATPARTAEQPSPKAEETPAKTPDTVQKPQEIKTISYSGILDRFRAYQGEKTPAIMMALFSKTVAPLLRQEPPIAISDGKTSIKILADLSSGSQASSPNFAFSGARMISLKRDDNGTWIIELLPQADILRATVTILDSSSITEYPLTLVPPAVASPLESDFSAFLRDSGAAKPKFDLNKDGKHDSVDDYIYTGHYLILKNKSSKQKAP